jgi:hypothetical protein
MLSAAVPPAHSSKNRLRVYVCIFVRLHCQSYSEDPCFTKPSNFSCCPMGIVLRVAPEAQGENNCGSAPHGNYLARLKQQNHENRKDRKEKFLCGLCGLRGSNFNSMARYFRSRASAAMLRYLAPQHFLYFFPLPHGHGSLRPAATARNLGAVCFCLDTNLASGSRQCRKKRLRPAHRKLSPDSPSGVRIKRYLGHPPLHMASTSHSRQ